MEAVKKKGRDLINSLCAHVFFLLRRGWFKIGKREKDAGVKRSGRK